LIANAAIAGGKCAVVKHASRPVMTAYASLLATVQKA
jgi:hypothetical protein